MVGWESFWKQNLPDFSSYNTLIKCFMKQRAERHSLIRSNNLTWTCYRKIMRRKTLGSWGPSTLHVYETIFKNSCCSDLLLYTLNYKVNSNFALKKKTETVKCMEWKSTHWRHPSSHQETYQQAHFSKNPNTTPSKHMYGPDFSVKAVPTVLKQWYITFYWGGFKRLKVVEAVHLQNTEELGEWYFCTDSIQNESISNCSCWAHHETVKEAEVVKNGFSFVWREIMKNGGRLMQSVFNS